MKYIKLFEDYRILEKTPEKFFLVLRSTEETYQALSQLEINGLKGISDNPDIIHAFFDIRPIMLVMDGNEVLKLNKNIHKVDYMNPHQLVANNFSILSRLKQDSELRLWSIFNSFETHISQLKYMGWRNREKNKDLVYTTIFFKEHSHEVQKIIQKKIDNGLVINNLWELTNEIIKAYKSLNKEDKIRTDYRSSSRTDHTQHYDMVVNNPRYTYYMLQEVILDITKTWVEREGEWIIKKDKVTGERIFKIPPNSTLYFKTNLDPNDEKELEEIKSYQKSLKSWNDGFTDNEEYVDRERYMPDLQKRIKQYNLDSLYNIEYVKGHYRAYELMKKYKYTKTKTHSPLMKNPMDKRIKKNFYKKK